MTVFVDTYALIAWLNPRDAAHSGVREYLAAYTGRLVTTEWVLMEVADALATPHARRAVIAFLQRIRNDSSYEIVGYEDKAYDAGFALFSTHHDDGQSAVTEAHVIVNIAAFTVGSSVCNGLRHLVENNR